MEVVVHLRQAGTGRPVALLGFRTLLLLRQNWFIRYGDANRRSFDRVRIPGWVRPRRTYLR